MSPLGVGPSTTWAHYPEWLAQVVKPWVGAFYFSTASGFVVGRWEVGAIRELRCH